MLAMALPIAGNAAAPIGNAAPPVAPLLQPQSFHHYFDRFAAEETEFLGEAPPVPWDWFKRNLPWLDIPDKQMEEIYYFRWYSFQKHIRKTPDGYIIDEFLDNVPWAGKFNGIDAAAEHHLREARWLRDAVYANQDGRFWLSPDGNRSYSSAIAPAVYSVYLATGDKAEVVALLPALIRNFNAWDDHRDANGLYWSIDDRDGMEKSIGGSGYRPTINSYMFGDAMAIGHIAELAGDEQLAKTYFAKAARIRALVEDHLWNPKDRFYETVPRQPGATWVGVREEIGYVPWYYGLPPLDHAVAWKQLMDPQGFLGQYGPTTAERRNPRFMFHDPHESLWNGPSWPFATTQTLVGLANLLNGPAQSVIGAKQYFEVLQQYVLSQHIKDEKGKTIPWIDENLNADTGEWIARGILESRHQLPANRGRYYNHSGFADLIITGLLGIRPSAGDELKINPLLPANTWSYFALQDVPYHGHLLTLVYDKTGQHYHRGAGLRLYCDGVMVASAPAMQPLSAHLPPAVVSGFAK